jgi:hypothetical protein
LGWEKQKLNQHLKVFFLLSCFVVGGGGGGGGEGIARSGIHGVIFDQKKTSVSPVPCAEHAL